MLGQSFDPLAVYAAAVSTVVAAFEIWRKLRRLSLEASTYPVLSGDFAGDLSPELDWRTLVTVRNTGGVPVVLERAEFVVYRNFLSRLLRRPLLTARAHAKLPVELESWKNAEFSCLQSGTDFALRLSKGGVWLALYHNHSRRPLLTRLRKKELSEGDLTELLQAYDGGWTDEQEEVLARIDRKQREQAELLKPKRSDKGRG